MTSQEDKVMLYGTRNWLRVLSKDAVAEEVDGGGKEKK